VLLSKYCCSSVPLLVQIAYRDVEYESAAEARLAQTQLGTADDRAGSIVAENLQAFKLKPLNLFPISFARKTCRYPSAAMQSHYGQKPSAANNAAAEPDAGRTIFTSPRTMSPWIPLSRPYSRHLFRLRAPAPWPQTTSGTWMIQNRDFNGLLL
jgi:hypothetical protein